jgi:hypothetical protein
MYELTGMADIEANLQELTQELRTKAVKKVVKDTIRPIWSMARSLVRKDTGVLYTGIQMEVKSKNKGAIIYGVVGIRRGIKIPVRIIARGRRKGQVLMAIPTRYAHLVERGHKIVTHAIWEKDPKNKFGRLRPIRDSMWNKLLGRPKKGGEVIGFARGRPFMRPAWDTHGKEQALKVFLNGLDKELKDAVTKLRRRRP